MLSLFKQCEKFESAKKSTKMIRNGKIVLQLFSLILILIVYIEYIHLYIVLSECKWPEFELEKENLQIEKNNDSLKMMVISDVHLIGPKKGIWIEKIMRDWQMYNVFHSALNFFQPEVVFILGDSIEEGLFLSPSVFDRYVEKVYDIFMFSEGKTYTIVGNHDIGFHKEITKVKNAEFITSFNSPTVEMITIKGNHIVMLNSMALEMDQCWLCQPAMDKLSEIEKVLKCAKGTYNGSCDDLESNSSISYSQPILMQHFPLYRPSDIECNDFDSAPFPEKAEKFKEAWDCLSKNATDILLYQIEPRLALSGHTHHGCTRQLSNGNGIEITIPSLNWRHKNNPSFGLGIFTPNKYAFVRCAIPKESTRIILYVVGSSLIAFWILRFKIKCRKKDRKKHDEFNSTI